MSGNILDRPPDEEEGDNAEAGGGKPVAPISENDLGDTAELEEDDHEDDDGPDI